MVRWVASLSFVLFAATCPAQKDSVAVASRPWIELSAASRGPAGNAGLIFGMFCGLRFTPAVAVGLGGSESMHLSVGAEIPLAQWRSYGAGAFGYWTYVVDTRAVVPCDNITGDQLLKFGGVLSRNVGRLELVLRAGYTFSFLNHATIYSNNGPCDTHMVVGFPDGVVLVGIGCRILFGHGTTL